MALQKQVVSVPLGVGIDTKTDKKQIQVGKLAVLENARFRTVGQIELRNGFDGLPENTLFDTPTETIVFDGELNVADNKKMWSYDSSTKQWISKGKMIGCAAQGFQVIRNSYDQFNPDVAKSGDLICYAWVDDRVSSCRTSVININSNQTVLGDVLITNSVDRVRVVEAYGIFFVYYSVGTSIFVTQYSPSTNSWSTPTLFANNAVSLTHISVSKCGNSAIVCYVATGNNIRFGYIKPNGLFAAPIDGFPSPVQFSAGAAVNCIDVTVYFASSNTDAVYISYSTGTTVFTTAYETTFLNLYAPVTVGTGVAAVLTIGGVMKTDQQLMVFWTVSAPSSTNRITNKNTITYAGVAGGGTTILRSVGLCAKPFKVGDDVFIVTIHVSPLQATHFVHDESGTVVSRISYQNAGVLPAYISNVVQISDKLFLVPTQVKGRLRSEQGAVYGVIGIQGTQLNFDQSKLFNSQQLQRNQHICGGLVYGYDGVRVTELGFHLYPEIITSALSGGGAITAGTRSYVFLYEWTDAQGAVHRSSPSPALTVTFAANQQLTLGLPTLRLTEKENVSIVVYRTVAAGSVFYRITSINAPVGNDKTVDQVSYVDNTPDGTAPGGIRINEIVYTSGGVIENIPPPSATAVCDFNNRLVLAGLEDPNEFWYSKVADKNNGTQTSDFFTGRIDAGARGIFAVAGLDDKLILWKRNALYALPGQGPNDTGQQNDFVEPQLITSDVGCTEPRSVVSMPEGIMFKSAKGYYILTRSLQTAYIGAEVEEFNGLTVSSAELIESTNEIRITHLDGPAIVYDYFTKQWSTYTNYAAISAVNWDGAYTIVDASGTVRVENKETYLDEGSPIQMRVVTPWISLGQLQGFQRVYQAIFLGDMKSKHTFEIRVGYDFEPDFRESFIAEAESILGSSVWGSSATWGSDSVWGGVDPKWQFKVKPKIQKCQAIRFQIRSLVPDGTDGAQLTLSAMGLMVGIKGGLNRLAATRVVAPS